MGDVTRPLPRLPLALSAILLGACAAEQPPAPPEPAAAGPAVIETFEAAGHTLALLDDAGACVVDTGAKRLYLEMSAPCRYVRSPEGSGPQAKSYPDARVTVVVVVGSPLEAFLGRRSRGLLLSADGVALSPRIAEGRWSPAGVDEKELWLFSH